MGLLDRSIHVSFSIRPFAMLVRATGLSLLLLGACVPAPVGHLPLPPVVLTETDILRNRQVTLVFSELEPRLKNHGDYDVRKIAETIVSESAGAGLDPLFVLAVIEAESNFDTEACSSSKAKGLMQILPSTFRSLNPTGSIFDPVENVRAGTRYLSLLTRSFKRPESVLMAYNGGPGTAGRYIRARDAGDDVEAFSWEMRSYPHKVMSNYKRLLAKTGQKPALAHKLYLAAKPKIVVAMQR
jgi:hypothetical protein